MKNIDKLCLEYKKFVNNDFNDKPIKNLYHIISKEDMRNAYLDYQTPEYVGFDVDSLDFYENWLGGDIGRY